MLNILQCRLSRGLSVRVGDVVIQWDITRAPAIHQGSTEVDVTMEVEEDVGISGLIWGRMVNVFMEAEQWMCYGGVPDWPLNLLVKRKYGSGLRYGRRIMILRIGYAYWEGSHSTNTYDCFFPFTGLSFCFLLYAVCCMLFVVCCFYISTSRDDAFFYLLLALSCSAKSNFIQWKNPEWKFARSYSMFGVYRDTG